MKRLIIPMILVLCFVALGCGENVKQSLDTSKKLIDKGSQVLKDPALESCRLNQKTINNAVDKYFKDQGTYPNGLGNLTAYIVAMPICQGIYSLTPDHKATCSKHGQL